MAQRGVNIMQNLTSPNPKPKETQDLQIIQLQGQLGKAKTKKNRVCERFLLSKRRLAAMRNSSKASPFQKLYNPFWLLKNSLFKLNSTLLC